MHNHYKQPYFTSKNDYMIDNEIVNRSIKYYDSTILSH